jgi:hypothetical protein
MGTWWNKIRNDLPKAWWVLVNEDEWLKGGNTFVHDLRWWRGFFLCCYLKKSKLYIPFASFIPLLLILHFKRLGGVFYWPIVDLISYSLIPIKLIPLFVNMASFVWTIYLSLVANKGMSTSSASSWYSL